MNELATMSFLGEAQYAELSDKGRRTVRERCAAMERMLKAPQGSKTFVEQREAAHLGICTSAFRRLSRVYRKNNGHWTSMIDWRAEPHKDDRLPAAFLDFWKSLCEDNQRKNKPAHRVLRQLYWSKAASYTSPKGWSVDLWPGYADRPAISPFSKEGLPRGWSYANLSLPCNSPTKLERTANRQGPIAAGDLLPMVFTTRKNLRPGQFYVFDDRWNDLKVIVPGRMSKPVRTIELSAGDVFSGKTVSWGLIPLVEDDDGKRQQITGDYMRMLLVDLLCKKGFHRDGCTLMVEHGTAAIPADLEHVLGVVSEGRIKVERSGIQGGVSFAGGFPTLGKGNFRFKAGWESMHNLKHNELANLPGQTGRNSRLETVEEMHGREMHAVKMLLAATETRPETAKILLSGTGFLPFSEFFWAFSRVLAQIESYTDHEMEGWTEAGLVTSEYRLDFSAPWQPMEKLHAYGDLQRSAIIAQIESEPWATRSRQLSRGEAWRRGERDLIRLPLHIAPQIFGEKMCVPRTVNDAMRFEFRCADAGDDDLLYNARRVTSPNGAVSPLQAGATYRTWINFLDPSILFVATAEGNYLGTCDLISRADKADDEAIKRAAGQAAAMKAEAVEPLYRRALRRNAAQTKANQQIVAALEHQATTSGNTTIEDYDAPNYGAMNKNSHE